MQVMPGGMTVDTDVWASELKAHYGNKWGCNALHKRCMIFDKIAAQEGNTRILGRLVDEDLVTAAFSKIKR